MPVKGRRTKHEELVAMFGHLRMVETFAAHQARAIDKDDASVAERKLCIATPAGLTQCGKTAHRTLQFCTLAGVDSGDICGECYGQMRQVVQDIKDGVRVL